MASHQIAIAKASFAASLLRPDPLSVARDEINNFQAILDDAVSRCSPSNVQKCKNWLLQNVTQSSGRITSLGKYLTALSNSFGMSPVSNGSNKELPARIGSVKRRRLHILYILNDLFHHAKYHDDGAAGFGSLTITLHTHVLALLTSASSFPEIENAKHFAKIEGLLGLWAENAYYSPQHLVTLREVVKQPGLEDGRQIANNGVNSATGQFQKASKDTMFVMPSTHGDPATPYYDLPAGNLIPHIVPNSKTPIDPRRVKPLQFMAGPAGDALSNVVKDFLRDAETIYNGFIGKVDSEGKDMDIDEMGQVLVKDEVMGEYTAIEGYYGWSVAFCERMTRRKNGDLGEERGASRDRGRSESSSPRKRRRYSSGSSNDRSRSRGRDRRHHKSRSRSRSNSLEDQPRRAAFKRAPSPGLQRNAATMKQEAPSVPQRPQITRNHLSAAHLRPSYANATTPVDQIDNPFSQVMPAAPSAHAANHFAHNYPMGPNGMPVPPPPPFHQGPWPPPPPNMPFPFNNNQYPMGGFMPPPPPQGLQPGWQPMMKQYGNSFSPQPPPPPPQSGPTSQGYYSNYQGQAPWPGQSNQGGGRR